MLPSERYAPLVDLQVRSDAKGRIIDAYAAVFDTPQEIRDREGHYVETVDRAAFDRTIEQKRGDFQVLFNHAKTLHGTPSERFSLPYGTPEEVRPDGRGLFTSTRMADTPLAEELYTLVDTGAIKGMSFSGQFLSTRSLGRDPETGLVRKHRTEVMMREYGLTPFPAYRDAQVVGVRAEFAQLVEEMDVDELAAFLSDLTQPQRAELIDALNRLPAATGTEADAAPDTRTAVDPKTVVDLAIRRDRILRKDIAR